jgi:hypothetical protein
LNEHPVAKYLKKIIVSAVKLQKKWKSIRDRYTRERNTVTKSGSGASTSREYIYTKFLTFLNPQSRVRPPKSPLSCSSDKQSKKGNTPKESTEEKLLEILCERMQNKCQNKNYVDQQFFMSLVEDFAAIHSDYKMDAKMEIMGIIKKYTQMSRYTRPDHTQQGYFTARDSPTLSSTTLQAPQTDQDETSQESLYGNLYSEDTNDYFNL